MIVSNQTRPVFCRFVANGASRKGNRISATAAPGRVSVKAAVITYVPAGVVDVMVMVNVLVLAE
jgi:hypothetical protein